MITWKHATAAAGIALCFASTLVGQIDEAARQALLDSAEAIKNMQTVSYKASKFGTGPLKGLIDVTGDVRVMRPESGKAGPVRWYVDGRIGVAGSPDKLFRVSTDGQSVVWLDFDENLLNERPRTDRRGGKQNLDLAKQLLLEEFTDSDPFKTSLTDSEAITLKGVEAINGVPCNVIETVGGEGKRRREYHIGLADRLPRRMAMITGNAEMAVSLVLELAEVNTKKLALDDLKVTAPPGFREARQAPQPSTPPPPPPPVIGLEAGTKAPTFSLTTGDGKTRSIEDYAGETVVMLFWGTRFAKSVECIDLIHDLSQFFDGEAIHFVSISSRESSSNDPVKMLSDKKAKFDHLLRGETIMQSYRVMGFPSMYVITPRGEVSAFFQGCPSEEDLLGAIEKAAG